jgi:hypothetical protein
MTLRLFRTVTEVVATSLETDMEELTEMSSVSTRGSQSVLSASFLLLRFLSYLIPFLFSLSGV